MSIKTTITTYFILHLCKPSQMFSHYPPKENGFGVSVSQRGPLHEEIVWYRVQDPPRQWQRLHPANAFNINYEDFLHSQNSKQESCHTQGDAGPRAVTQHLKQHTHR